MWLISIELFHGFIVDHVSIAMYDREFSRLLCENSKHIYFNHYYMAIYFVNILIWDRHESPFFFLHMRNWWWQWHLKVYLAVYGKIMWFFFLWSLCDVTVSFTHPLNWMSLNLEVFDKVLFTLHGHTVVPRVYMNSVDQTNYTW